MTTTLLNYNDPIYSTTYLDQYSGVVQVGNGTNGGTGSLLYDGRTILTAAHIFNEEDDNNRVSVYFETVDGYYQSYEGVLSVYENYDSVNINGDLALITLDENISHEYNRYQLYSDSDEIGKEFTMVGYGNYGSGDTGQFTDSSTTLKLKTKNSFDTDIYALDQSNTTNFLWDPLEDAILAADFDNGHSENDMFDFILDLSDTGLGDIEGLIASGDSGGPAFIDSAIAGVASYGSTIDSLNSPDINDTLDASFGEFAAWQRVSYYSEWIDKQIRANLPDIPTSKEDIIKEVIENDSGITYAYFMVEYLGDRSLILDNITLDYTTKDGTATAGEDYVETSGVITLYSDESQVFIPVEIIADTIAEEDETFYLEVSNPSHGSLGEDMATLTAVRTIIDDDGYIG